MSSMDKGRGITVTIKYGKGYEETWAVFNGQTKEVREDIISYFGCDDASVAEMTLSELVVNVTSLAHGKGNVAAILGGVVVATKDTADEGQQSTGSSDPWAGTEDAASAPAVNPLLSSIEAATDVDALKVLWAGNQSAFTADADLMAAWKAKGKALKAAS